MQSKRVQRLEQAVASVEIFKINWVPMLSVRLCELIALTLGRYDSKFYSSYETATLLDLTQWRVLELQEHAARRLERIRASIVQQIQRQKIWLIMLQSIQPYLQYIENLALEAIDLQLDFETCLDVPIQELKLSHRTHGVLHRHGIKTLSDILHHKNDLPLIKGMGIKSIEEIQACLIEQFAVDFWKN